MGTTQERAASNNGLSLAILALIFAIASMPVLLVEPTLALVMILIGGLMGFRARAKSDEDSPAKTIATVALVITFLVVVAAAIIIIPYHSEPFSRKGVSPG
jgi:cytochrome bd-type quinol oxidase subunit 2